MRELIVVTLVVLLLVGVFFTGSFWQRHIFTSDREALAYYRENHLSKQGYIKGFGNYHIRSFDGGENWVAVRYTDDWKIEILGPVEEIHPGLLGAIQGLGNLFAYVGKNGTINFEQDRRDKDIRMLEEAGFEIKVQTSQP